MNNYFFNDIFKYKNIGVYYSYLEKIETPNNDNVKEILEKYFSVKGVDMLLKFYYIYTKLDINKLEKFTDGNLIEFSFPIVLNLINSTLLTTTNYKFEDGSSSSTIGIYDYDVRREYLYYLLKCKYNSEQSHSILDYYTELTNLDYDKLTTELKLYEPDWKEIANRMEYNKDGKVESTFNFISGVIL